jgi:hyperosmotically inducible periplasmic protein
MFRFLFRLIVLVVVIGVVGVFLLGWWPGGGVFTRQPGDRPIEPGRIDTSRAREVGAEISAKAAQAANQAQVALSDGSITAKIKAKMALDDSVKANEINVDFANGVVTLTGTVRTAAERKRAVDLARETQGVTSVTDRLATAER